MNNIFNVRFPVDPKTKRPLTKNGYKDATSNYQIIENWKEKFPGCGWAIPTGKSFFVVDIDKKNNGLENWDKLIKEYGTIEKTILVKTQNGGLHLYFKMPENTNIRNNTGKLGQGIDIRGTGGYVVIPPTSGYEFIYEDIELANPPSWLLELILKDEHKPFTLHEKISEGERNTTLFKLASSLRAKGVSEGGILAALLAENINRCIPPLEEKEIETIVNSVTRYEQGEIQFIEKYSLTDLGNAKRLVEIHGDKLRYCEEDWYIWNGKFWEKDTTNKIYSLVEDVIKLLYKEASEAKDSEERKLLAQHANRSESAYSAKNLLFWAKSKLSITPEEFDTDKELLNVQNGIINLRTGELLLHDSKYLMRKIIQFEYVPDAQCPKWLEFLNYVLRNDEDTIYWIQKALGLSISGRSDRILPFLWGTGGNGKSVFSEVLLKLFGDYGQKTSIEAFSISDFQEAGDKPNSYLARLKGARFVIANETREDGKLNVSLIKDLTGVDTITARDLREKAGQFIPTHTLWIYGNHKPKIDDTTDSIWDRMCEIPFLVKIPDDIKKPLDMVVNEFLSEGEGILFWIIQGYQLWLKEGLKKTKTIEITTNEYRTEEDIFKQFIDEEMELGEEYTIPKDELIREFSEYCFKNGEKKATFSKKKITRRLGDMGIKDTGRGAKLYKGIRKIDTFTSISYEKSSVQQKIDNLYNNPISVN